MENFVKYCISSNSDPGSLLEDVGWRWVLTIRDWATITDWVIIRHWGTIRRHQSWGEHEFLIFQAKPHTGWVTIRKRRVGVGHY